MPKKQEVEARPSHVIAYHALQDALGTLTALKPQGREQEFFYNEVVSDLMHTFAYFNTFVFIPAQGEVKAE